jgi:hypothetical protein
MASNLATIGLAVAVSAVTSFFVGRATAREASERDASATSFKESLRDVERALDDIRQSLAKRPALAPSPTAPSESTATLSAAAPARRIASPGDEPSAGSRPAPPAGATGPMLPPANFSRAKEIHEWDDNEEVRRRWFLVSDADALAVFGTPTFVSGWETGERWDYSNDDWAFSLCFLRGRLVHVFSK